MRPAGRTALKSLAAIPRGNRPRVILVRQGQCDVDADAQEANSRNRGDDDEDDFHGHGTFWASRSFAARRSGELDVRIAVIGTRISRSVLSAAMISSETLVNPVFSA